MRVVLIWFEGNLFLFFHFDLFKPHIWRKVKRAAFHVTLSWWFQTKVTTTVLLLLLPSVRRKVICECRVVAATTRAVIQPAAPLSRKSRTASSVLEDSRPMTASSWTATLWSQLSTRRLDFSCSEASTWNNKNTLHVYSRMQIFGKPFKISYAWLLLAT